VDEALIFDGPDTGRVWLEAIHKTASSLWLMIAKKNANVTIITYAEALDVALCYGWIDGHKKAHDKRYFLQRLSPRGKNSIWSKINRAKVLALINRGLMQEQGLLEIERAKANGRWDAAYDGAKTIGVPPDFAAALEANSKANAFFKTINSQNRFAILFRIGNAKRAETRAKKIAKFVTMLEQGELIY
jgi:uncharacterized protein YdeI (YjbR/CyaY-like superfamily)